MGKMTAQELINILKGDKQLLDADLRGLYLEGFNLSGGNFTGAKFSDAVLLDADLSGANLSNADFSGVDLSRTNLTGANLSGANLAGVKFGQKPKLTTATLPDGRLYTTDIDLADFTGPENALHVTVNMTPEGSSLNIQRGLPGQFDLVATSVEWLSKDDADVIIHLCGVFLTDEQLGEIATQTLLNKD